MPVKTIGVAEFGAHLDEIGLASGMHVSVHARLLSFGHIDGGAQVVFEALRERVGDEGTLAFPTYTLNLGQDDIYDRDMTPSYGMGALSEFARSQPEVKRTHCPMHGHAVIGAEANAVMDADFLRSLGAGSAFQAMCNRDFRLLLLGCSFQEGATFVHHVEAMHGIPYREWLELPRRIRTENGDVESVRCHYYGRMPHMPWTTDLSAVEQTVRQDGIGKSLNIGNRTSYLLSLTKLKDCVSGMLDEHTYALMRHNDPVASQDSVDHVA